MNKKYQTFLVLFIVTFFNLLLTFTNGYAGLVIDLKTDLIVKLTTNIDTQIIRVGGLSTEAIIITAETKEQDLQFEWNIDGPGKLLENATSQNVYTPPDKIDGEIAKATITVTATDDKGNQGSDKLTFTLIPFSTQEQLIRLRLKLNTEKYETLIKQEQEGVSVNDQIIPILEEIIKEIIKGLNEIKDICEELSQTHSIDMSQSLRQIQDEITRYEEELTALCEFDITGLFIKDSSSMKKLGDTYSVKPGKSITITVDFTNPCNHDFDIAWSALSGRIGSIDIQTTTYTAPEKTGGTYIIVNVFDKKTGEIRKESIIIDVIK